VSARPSAFAGCAKTIFRPRSEPYTSVVRNVRKTVSSPPRCAVPDAPGHAYKPTVTTQEDFVQALGELLVWAGNPSLREVSRRCGGSPVHSAFSKMLKASTVPPRFALVEAFVTALGMTGEDVEEWATAWRGLVMPFAGACAQDDGTAAPPVLRLTGT
jgi:hypothetical protein